MVRAIRSPDGRTSKKKPVVRASVISVVGGVAALGAFGISAVGGGLVEATSFLLGIFIAAVTIGLTAAEIAGAWLDRPPKASRIWPSIRGRRAQQVSGMTCSSCGRLMRQLDSIWVCDACDLVGVDT
jgi:hypothetical protein